jgi:5-formyltetrahydrofolate cyclo-ligase
LSATDKQALRQRLIAARKSLEPRVRAGLSAAIAARVAALPRFAAARGIALYWPLGAEVDTAELARLAAGEGKVLLWPRVSPGWRALRFAACAPGELVQGPLGAREPPPGAPEVELGAIDVACVPGVGFDPALRRLGRGGGYYDATLPALAGRALRLGLAFECQVVAELPAEAHDAGVDLVATESRLLGPAGI